MRAMHVRRRVNRVRGPRSHATRNGYRSVDVSSATIEASRWSLLQEGTCVHTGRELTVVLCRGMLVGATVTCLSIFCARQHARPAELSVSVSRRELCCSRTTALASKRVWRRGVWRVEQRFFFHDFPQTNLSGVCLLTASLRLTVRKQSRILH
jgi:hypothetical protein